MPQSAELMKCTWPEVVEKVEDGSLVEVMRYVLMPNAIPSRMKFHISIPATCQDYAHEMQTIPSYVGRLTFLGVSNMLSPSPCESARDAMGLKRIYDVKNGTPNGRPINARQRRSPWVAADEAVAEKGPAGFPTP